MHACNRNGLLSCFFARETGGTGMRQVLDGDDSLPGCEFRIVIGE